SDGDGLSGSQGRRGGSGQPGGQCQKRASECDSRSVRAGEPRDGTGRFLGDAGLGRGFAYLACLRSANAMTIRFERTTDLELVRQILTRPKIWPHIGDDFAPPVNEFRPNEDPRIWYVLASFEAHVLGLFMFLPESPVCWEMHASSLPEHWGPRAHEA